MERPSPSAQAWRGRIALGAALAAGAFAYRALLVAFLASPDVSDIDGWILRPSQLPTLLVVGVAAWLLWMRRARLSRAPRAPATPWAVAFALPAAGLLAWSQATRTVDLLLPSLACSVLAVTAAVRGAAGARVVALPCAVLLFGLQIPPSLQAELVWLLQRMAAAGAAGLLAAVGEDFSREGVLLLSPDHTIHVIDACSGVTALMILLLVALLVRELFAESGRTARLWALVPLAALLAYTLNALRIAWIAMGPSPESLSSDDADHAFQGVSVLAAGTAALYVAGALLSRRAGDATGAAGSTAGAAEDPAGGSAWLAPAGGLALLALLSVVVRPFTIEIEGPLFTPVEFPERHDQWESSPLEANRHFVGPLPSGQSIYRKYARYAGGRVDAEVDVFVGKEVRRFTSSSRLLSSRLQVPGPLWSLERSREVRLWSLDRPAILSVARRGDGEERAVVYTLRLRDRGMWTEALRALFAVEATPWRTPTQRGVVQLVAYAPFDGPLAIDRAKQRLDTFVRDFQAPLRGL